jgi:hypothetical protein
MSDKTRHSDSGRIFWGLALILVGALVLLKRFDIWDLGYLLSTWWPAILILIGISLLIGNRFRRPGAGLLLIIIGAMFLLWELGYLEVDVWRKVWPAALIVIGLWIIFRPVIRPRSSGTVPPAPGDDIDTQGFNGGEATAVLGGADLDFTNAGLEGGRATVEATAIFGGVDIIVPKNWRVIMDGTPILGGFNLKHANPPEAEAKATLHVRGTAIFGGVTVKD